MATKYEQALALSKEKNIPVPEAVAQVRNQATVSATSAGNQMQYEINKQNRQNMANAGTIPAVGTSVTPQAGQAPTPVNAPTPVATVPPTEMPQKEVKQFNENGELINPTAQDVATYNQNVQTFTPSKEVQPAKQVTPKVEAPIDYTQAQGREQDIIKNLETFKAQNMTPEQIMRASDYQNASPEKKALIDPYLKQQLPTASAMYNAIATKADIPDDQKTTLPFKIAQNRYTKANSFATMTASQLANEMDNSRFIQGSQSYEDVKAMNPKLVQDTENLRIVNGKKQNVFTYINNPDGTSTKVNNLEKTFAEEYMDNFGDVIKKMFTVQTPEEIRAIIYTDDVKQAQDKATEIELTMNELEKQMDNVDAEVDKEFAGSGATGSRIALEKSIRKDKLGKEYNSQLKNYTTYANKANNLITQNTTVYTTQQQQKQAQNAAMLPFLTDQYKTEQEKIKAQEALNDPYKAIPAMIEEYKKLGIPFTRSTQQIIKDFESSGKDISTFLTDLQTTIQSKPEYQAYKDKQSGTEWQSTSITRYNPATGANESTPIFYRKKTNGEFEAVDLSGNKIDSSVLSGGMPTGISTGSTINKNEATTKYGSTPAVRNFNPGNIMDTGFGGKKVQGERFTVFDTPQEGFNALVSKIQNIQSGNSKVYSPDMTLLQYISKYAPSSDNNNPTAYANAIAKNLGITSNTKIKDIDPVKLAEEHARHEDGNSYRMLKDLGIIGGGTSIQTNNSNPLQIKEFEAYDGKAIPAQYKTPLEQDDFVKRYNAWRASRPGVKIETGNDILNIKLDKGGTEAEKTSQSYTSRMLNAVNNLMPLEEKYAELSLAEQLKQQYLPTVLKSDEQKQIDLNKKNFITAVLRKQSGASIAPSEFAGEEVKYFPQPGDSKEVIVAKQNARNAEIKAMLATAGVDTEGNSLSKYYNPPVIIAQSTTGESIDDRLKRIRNSKKQ